MLDGVIEVVAVLEPRPVVADGLADDGIENDGQQAAGEAVVIQVNALHRGSGVEHHGGVEEPRHDAEGPAEIARDRGQSGSEQEGELHGTLVDIEAVSYTHLFGRFPANPIVCISRCTRL